MSRLEDEMREERAARARLEAAVLRVETILTTALPHLATKADVADCKSELKLEIARLDADKPGKAYMWLIMTALLAAYACGLAALAVLK
jgi:hypothetical protein